MLSCSLSLYVSFSCISSSISLHFTFSAIPLCIFLLLLLLFLILSELGVKRTLLNIFLSLLRREMKWECFSLIFLSLSPSVSIEKTSQPGPRVSQTTLQLLHKPPHCPVVFLCVSGPGSLLVCYPCRGPFFS